MRNTSNPVFNDNKLKLGIFCTNGAGAAMTTLPERYQTSWPLSIETARMADEAGLEAIVPYARWKGYTGKADDSSGVVMDPMTWAAGIAQATSYSAVFATTHAPTVHPLLAAKQGATVDIISGGRFALNVVGGWNKPELEMFGAPLKEHDQRYDQLQEWLEIVERLWTDDEEFTHHGEFYNVIRGTSAPKPVQKPHPPIMNAGGSGRGRRFACEFADICFVLVGSLDPEKITAQVSEIKNFGRTEFGREVQVWTTTFVVQRDTDQEARDYHRWYSIENEDTANVDAWMRLQQEQTQVLPPAVLAQMRHRFASGAGGVPLVGTAQTIADRLSMLAGCGIDGLLLTWVDYVDGIKRFTEGVLPLIEEAGLRAPFQPRSASAGGDDEHLGA